MIRSFLAFGLLASFSLSFADAAASKTRYPVITHVLDVSKGKPGNGIKVQFYRKDKDGWRLFQDTLTNSDGRIGNLIEWEDFTAGIYKLVFNLGPYFKREGKQYYFHPRADVTFKIKDPKKLYQVTLIFSPYSYVVSSVRRIID